VSPATHVDASSDSLIRPLGWRLESRFSAPCCETLSQLLELLARGAPTREIAATVVRAQQLAAGGDIVLVREADTLTINETPAQWSTVASLHRMLSEHHVGRVGIDRHVEQRDVLQFAALLNGPTRANGPSFADLWHRLGVWRITVHFDAPADGDERRTDSHDGAPPIEQCGQRMADAIAGDDPQSAFAVMRSLCHAEQEAPAAERDAASARFDRVATAEALRLLGRLIPMGEPVRAPDDPLRAILHRSGDRASATLFSQLTTAPTAGERRMMFDAIVAVGHASSLFVSSLRHPSWYVVRNAAALVGALRMVSADEALVQTLRHPDARVRVAVVDALARLPTPIAVRALMLAMNDRASEVRHAALHALEVTGAAIPSPLLTAALEKEDREIVQLELIFALATCSELETAHALSRFCARVLAHGGSITAALAALEVMVGHRASSATTFLKHLDAHDDARVRTQVARIRELAMSATAQE
jgi:hypothetical protein